MSVNALCLISGGLDSHLAMRTLQAQWIECTAICFRSCFFHESKAKEAAKQSGVELIVEDISNVHLEMVKDPKHGYGKYINPCVDCHGMMFAYAANIMKREGYDFLATGEVLGQRPMSQNKWALDKVRKITGTDRIIRPLNAQSMDMTPMEKEGIVNQGKLHNITGRSRKPQMALAKEYKIEDYPSPAGGCKLTDPQYAKRLKAYLAAFPNATKEEIPLIRYGRHFWERGSLICMGRDKDDNLDITQASIPWDMLLWCQNAPGPIACVRPGDDTNAHNQAKELIIGYNQNAKNLQENGEEIIFAIRFAPASASYKYYSFRD